MNKVDITGTMTKPIPGWEERVERLCKPENFWVSVVPNKWLMVDELTEEEADRLERKLKLVQRYTAYMAAGMLKGTLKYPTDDIPVETWIAHLIGEGSDLANYQILLADAYYNVKEN